MRQANVVSQLIDTNPALPQGSGAREIRHMLQTLRAFAALTVLALSATGAGAQRPARVLLVPLDDRPSSLQWPERLGAIAGATVVAPPREMLGRFATPGRPAAIIAWLRRQDLASFDAAIISLDMLAYGGLVASRTMASATTDEALARIGVVHELKRRAPRLRVYGQSVGMRLAPTADGSGEAYRVALARWAEIAPSGSDTSGRDTSLARETRELEARIPAAALAAYRATRARNHRLNEAAVDLAAQGILDLLVLSQDDARPRGLHVREREALAATVTRRALTARVVLQPGTDEVAMLLLARALRPAGERRERVAAIYADPATADRAMPYEDQPLRETIRRQLMTAGAEFEPDPARATLRLYVLASRGDTSRTLAFADTVTAAMARAGANSGVAVADVDPRGNVQGGDSVFTEALLRGRRVADLDGYAAWNTAGNAIGTTLAQALIRRAAGGAVNRTAQAWFLLDRFVDDYAYHTLVRPALQALSRTRQWSAIGLSPDQAREAEGWATPQLRTQFTRLADVVLPSGCAARDMVFRLPWDRAFEAEFDFSVHCRQARGAVQLTEPSLRGAASDDGGCGQCSTRGHRAHAACPEMGV
jgi:hypothetical protein